MKRLKIENKLNIERNNCPECTSDKYKVIYKSKKKHPESRYFMKLKCEVCGLEYVAESKKEFKERLKDWIQ